MQTFAPYPDAARSAAVLDNQRCGKNRVETYQILLWLHGVQMWDWDHRIMVPRDPTGPRFNHPAIKLWSGSERALGHYQDAFCDDWTGRGYADTCKEKSRYIIDTIDLDRESEQLPPWWGDPDFHMRHRSNLVLKNPEFYGHIFQDDLPTREEVRSREDLYDGANYFAYHWPDGLLPFKQRKADNYARAMRALGTHDQIIAGKQEEFGWDDDHPMVTAYRDTFRDAIAETSH